MTTNLLPEQIAAINKALLLGLDSLRAEPPLPLSEWAAASFRLAGESSHQKGGWIAWAFQVGILDFMSDDRIEELSVMKSKRVGYTKMVTAFVVYNIVHRRRKQALWQPTDDDRDSYVKSEIDPVLDTIEAVQQARKRGKGSEDTIKLKQFRDSVLHLLGGKAARAYRRITVAVAILDEWSAFDQQVEKSGDPGGLAKGRLEGAPYPKFVGGSTPRLKGFCHVERGCANAAGFVRFHIDCPRCGADHPLSWGGKDKPYGFKWDAGQPDAVRHVCPHCHESITQADYLPGGVPMQGAWVCSRTGKRFGPDRVWRDSAGMPCDPPRTLGVQVWAAYSPQRSWASIVEEFIQANAKLKQGDTGPMQLFVNETLGETFEVEYERTEADFLEKRAHAEKLRMGIVPYGAAMVTAFIDVQGDRWEYAAWAFGRGYEMWAIDYRVIYGNTADLAEWDTKIAPLASTSYPHASGGRITISGLGIDTGFQTHAAYNFCRKHAGTKKVFATKGDSEPNKPIRGKRSLQDVNAYGRLVRKGVALHFIGTDTAKDLLHGLMQVQKPGPGYVHFASDLPTTFFAGITAESRVPLHTVKGLVHRWVCPPGKRNEPLDTCVGSMFVAEALGMATWTDAVWARLESALQPDLFAAPESAADAVPAPAPTPSVVDVRPASPPAVVHAQRQPASFASSDWSSRL